MPTPDDTPAVVAFRVGQLEKRFDSFDNKLDNLGGSFVTTDMMRDARLIAENEHKEFNERILKVETKVTSYPLIEKIVFTAVGIVLISVLGAIISLVVLKS